MPAESDAAPSPAREPSRDWDAAWIWAPDDPAAENSFYHVRHEVDLDPDGEVRLHVTADTHYRLFVDGEVIGQGPPFSQPYHKYYDTYAFDADELAGEHCVALLVNYTGTMPDTRGGLLLEAEAGGETLFGTDESWAVTAADGWRRDTFRVRANRTFPFQEHRDLRAVPGGWTEIGFDDADWATPDVVGSPPSAGPWTRLVPRDIPHMETTPRTASALTETGESLWLRNRFREGDRSITLSQPSTPLSHARIEDAGALLEEADTTTVQCSTGHREDPTVDGAYDPCVVLDFGRVVTGYLELDLGGVDGGVVDVGYAERLVDGEFNNAIEGQFADQFTLGDGEQTVRSFAWRSFRYVKLRFSRCFDPVEIEAVRAVLNEYPFSERGGFASGDEVLDDVYDISQYTLGLCSHDAVVDTPWREQAQWLGDVSAVTLGGIYSCFGDTALPGKFLRQSAANQQVTGLVSNVTNDVSHEWNPLSDYSLWWVTALWNHYEYTGEAAWVHDFYPHARKVVQAFEPFVTEGGLLGEVSYNYLFDWADVDRRGRSAPLNALFYAACGALESMADVVGDDHTRDRVAGYREGIAARFEDAFFDAERGCFVDCVVDGEQSDAASEHATAVALRWGLADESTLETAVETLYEAETVDYTEAQPFFTSVVLRGLAAVGRRDLALDVIRDRWGERMVARGAQSTFEEWGINGSFRSGEFDGFLRTLSHAWSACPAEFLTRDLVGFEVREPGCGRIALDPHDPGFDYEVTVPTPRGEVAVANEAGEVTVEAPDGVDVVTED